MIFVRYEPGSKGYQFWDAAHWCFKISCDVKFEESQFPEKEKSLIQPHCTSGAGPVLFEDRELQEEVGVDYIMRVGAELELGSRDQT